MAKHIEGSLIKKFFSSSFLNKKEKRKERLRRERKKHSFLIFFSLSKFVSFFRDSQRNTFFYFFYKKNSFFLSLSPVRESAMPLYSSASLSRPDNRQRVLPCFRSFMSGPKNFDRLLFIQMTPRPSLKAFG